jgi:histidine phosphotransferase ChpT
MVFGTSAAASNPPVTRTGAGTGRAIGAPSPGLELSIVQMLCSRLCHDLAGPAGAVGAGSEMLGEAAGGDADALELVTLGARQLAARLNYYRVAFGFGGTADTLSWPGVRALADGLFAGGRVAIHCEGAIPGTDGDTPVDVFRLALLLLLLGSEALPRGGTLTLAVTPARQGWLLSIRCLGSTVSLARETLAAIAGGEASSVTSRTVTAFYAAQLADTLGAAIVVDSSGAALDLRVALPRASTSA